MRWSPALLALALVLARPSAEAPSAAPLTAREKAVHLFGRLAYGPRPDDVEKLEKGGEPALRAWIAEQLRPETIPDAAVEAKLAKLKVPAMTSEALLARFRRPQQIAMEMGIAKEDFANREGLKKKIREKVGAENLPPEIVREMTSQKLVRAVESRRQLQEVLFDFWYNHFNVDIQKGQEKWLVPPYEREVLRPRLFGKFSSLLHATAHSPAMLFYLDNHLSQSEEDGAGGRGVAARKKRQTGLNENYARELLELHTLGVDGGYTQKDVTELARILTGWSIDSKTSPAFKFRARVHDRGEKTLLGARFPAGHGEDEGNRALEMLARHPATARFVALKLCRYFVADEPPKALVERVAKRFTSTDGDLSAVYREIFESAEFWSRAAYRAKIKRPLQFVVSAIRATGGEVDVENQLHKALELMGEEPYHCPPPTGYKDTADAWVNPGAMVSRLNFALRLAANRIDGVGVQLPRIADDGKAPEDPRELVKRVEAKLLHDGLSASSESVVMNEFQGEERAMADGEIRPLSLMKAVGLLVGSPEFQRR